MKKRGFTLIEIIICILLLAVIGTASLMGIRLINKNIKIDKLEKITDRVLKAAEIYIETNKETYNQLYKKKNGVVIPLNVLVNEGLLDLSGTTLEKKDIKDEYVISALATTTPTSSSSGCVDITTNASWNLSSDNPIYICTNTSSTGGGGTGSSGGSGAGNSIIIGGNTSNAESTKGERTYITNYTRNYISYNSKTYRLLYIDYDDSLVLYTTESTFGDAFNNITQETESDQDQASSLTDNSLMHPSNVNDSYCNRYTWCTEGKKIDVPVYNSTSACSSSTLTGVINNDDYNFYFTGSNKSYKFKYHNTVSNYIESGRWASTHGIAHKRINKTNKEQYIGLSDFVNLSNAAGSNPTFITSKKDLYVIDTLSIYSNPGCRRIGYLTGMKIQLRPCMKISEGIGTNVNPYKLVNMC